MLWPELVGTVPAANGLGLRGHALLAVDAGLQADVLDEHGRIVAEAPDGIAGTQQRELAGRAIQALAANPALDPGHVTGIAGDGLPCRSRPLTDDAWRTLPRPGPLHLAPPAELRTWLRALKGVPSLGRTIQVATVAVALRATSDDQLDARLRRDAALAIGQLHLPCVDTIRVRLGLPSPARPTGSPVARTESRELAAALGDDPTAWQLAAVITADRPALTARQLADVVAGLTRAAA